MLAICLKKLYLDCRISKIAAVFFVCFHFQILTPECFKSKGNLDPIRSLWSPFVRWLRPIYLSSSLSFFLQKYLLKAFPTFNMEYVLVFFCIPLPSLEWTYSSINHGCLGYAFPWKVGVHLNNSSFAPRDHYDAYVPLQHLSLPNYVRSIIVINTSTPSDFYCRQQVLASFWDWPKLAYFQG